MRKQAKTKRIKKSIWSCSDMEENKQEGGWQVRSRGGFLITEGLANKVKLEKDLQGEEPNYVDICGNSGPGRRAARPKAPRQKHGLCG